MSENALTPHLTANDDLDSMYIPLFPRENRKWGPTKKHSTHPPVAVGLLPEEAVINTPGQISHTPNLSPPPPKTVAEDWE